MKYVKFEHQVLRVHPLVNHKWEVIAKNLLTNEFETLNFDAVMVCNGHYHTPLFPQLKDANVFKGKEMHSHDYRCADSFKGDSVLVIGAGEMK